MPGKDKHRLVKLSPSKHCPSNGFLSVCHLCGESLKHVNLPESHMYTVVTLIVTTVIAVVGSSGLLFLFLNYSKSTFRSQVHSTSITTSNHIRRQERTSLSFDEIMWHSKSFKSVPYWWHWKDAMFDLNSEEFRSTCENPADVRHSSLYPDIIVCSTFRMGYCTAL